MPGPTVSGMLQPYNEGSFYKVLRALLYDLHHRTVAAPLPLFRAEITVRESHLGQYFATPDERAKLQATLSEQYQAFDDLFVYIRSFYHRFHLAQDFQPYDGVAWDALFAEITQGVKSRVQAIRQQIEPIHIPALSLPPDIGDDRLHLWVQNLQETKIEMEINLSSIEALLDVDYFDLWINQDRT